MRKVFCILVSLLFLFSGTFAAFHKSAATTNDAVNPPPQVIPAIQEWNGGKGRFTPAEGMKISLGSGGAVLNATDREAISDFFLEVMGYPITFSNQPPASGDIYFLLADDKTLPSEGYLMDASSILKISARTSIGFYYGMITFLQSVVAEGSFPNGSLRDYPQYWVRSGMLDVARLYIPLEYVESITKYFAWFKLNEIHLHINDNGTGFSAFRLESDVDGLTSEDGYYTKNEYRAYQKRMQKYHVEVITEISSPAHAGCFAQVVPDLMLDTSHLDVTKKETLTFITGLLDEYLSGSDPVFVSKKVHIGCDEYPEGYDNAVLSYLDSLIRYCSQKKYTARFWGSIGGNGLNGKMSVSDNAQINYWAQGLSDPEVLLKTGCKIINSYAPALYCVPGGNGGFPDYADIEALYSSWYVNYLGDGPSSAINSNHKNLAGACFALWNDLSYLRGYSCYDVFDRMRPLISLVAEKTWTGDHTRDLTAMDFVNRFGGISVLRGATLPNGVPLDTIDEDDFETYPRVGFPYRFDADVRWIPGAEEATILSGTYGSLIVSEDGTVGFRKTYGFLSPEEEITGERQFDNQTFWFDLALTPGEETHLSLFGTNEGTLLVVNETYAFTPSPEVRNGYTQSATFCLPLEQVGSETVLVENASVSAFPDDFDQLRLDGNLALKKTVTVHSLSERSNGTMAKYAVDGDTGTRVYFKDEDEQWLLIDLGAVHTVNQIVLRFFAHVPAYEVCLSVDGETFEKIYEISDGSGGNRKDDDRRFEARSARYVLFVQKLRYFHEEDRAYYSACLSEAEVYGWDSAYYDDLLLKTEAYPDDATLQFHADKLKKVLAKDAIFAFEVESIAGSVEARIAYLDYERRRSEEEESRQIEESLLEESVRADLSRAEEERVIEERRPLSWVLFVLSFLAVAVVFALLFLRSRKQRS